MPTRRLPNSDSSRLSALMAAKEKLDADQVGLPDETPPLSRATIRRLEEVLPQWESLVGERYDLLVAQNNASSNVGKLSGDLRVMVSHYIQVMNFAIDRGIAPIGMRASCGMDLNQKALPQMRTQQEVAFWASRMTRHLTTQGEGDYQNANPSAQDVADLLGEFETARASLKPAKTLYDTKQEEIEAMRPEVNELIRDIWDEIEFYYRKRPISSVRRRAREFGVIYQGLEEEIIEEPAPVDPPADEVPPVDEDPSNVPDSDPVLVAA